MKRNLLLSAFSALLLGAAVLPAAVLRPDHGEPAEARRRRCVQIPARQLDRLHQADCRPAGDRIQVRQGQLYINGQLCPRQPIGTYEAVDNGIRMVLPQYRETLPNGVKHEILKVTDRAEPGREVDPNNTLEYAVPPGHVFAMGDNRDNSADSRFMNGVGFVPLENLVGRAEFLFFSVDAQYPWWQIWQWPFEIRWSRLLRGVH